MSRWTQVPVSLLAVSQGLLPALRDQLPSLPQAPPSSKLAKENLSHTLNLTLQEEPSPFSEFT